MREDSMEMINWKSITSCIRNDWNNKTIHKTFSYGISRKRKKFLPSKNIEYYLLVPFTRAFGRRGLSHRGWSCCRLWKRTKETLTKKLWAISQNNLGDASSLARHYATLCICPDFGCSVQLFIPRTSQLQCCSRLFFTLPWCSQVGWFMREEEEFTKAHRRTETSLV